MPKVGFFCFCFILFCVLLVFLIVVLPVVLECENGSREVEMFRFSMSQS